MSYSEISAMEGLCFNRKIYNSIILLAILTTCLLGQNKYFLPKLSLRRRRMPEQLSQL